MKKAIFVFPFLLLINSSFAQPGRDEYTKQATLFLEWWFKFLGKPPIIAENLDTVPFNHLDTLILNNAFHRRVTYDNGKTTVIDSIRFSSIERKHIDSFFYSAKNFSFDTALLPHSIFFPLKAIDSIYKKSGGKQAVNSFFHPHFYGTLYFRISKPIFLRNYTLCIFYEETLAGNPLDEGGTLYIYKKINGTWKSFWLLEQWNI